MKTFNSWAVAVTVIASTYFFFRTHGALIRPAYPPVAIVVNPAGTCALTEYNFRGGERWSWTDPYRWFVLAPGDAFYTITDLRTGAVIRDSTTRIFPSMEANSQAALAMSDEVFRWSRDGGAANFPGGKADDYFHEWTNLHECKGESRKSDYADLICRRDTQSLSCKRLRSML